MYKQQLSINDITEEKFNIYENLRLRGINFFNIKIFIEKSNNKLTEEEIRFISFNHRLLKQRFGF